MNSAQQDLVAALRANRDEALATLTALSSEDLARGRYENGWNGLQILSHVAAIEWTYPRLLALARTTAEAPASAEPPAAVARGGIDAYNARQVELRAGQPAEALIEEWRRNRDALIAAVEAEDPASFDRPIRSAGGVTGTLASVIHTVAIGHVRQHVQDITGP